jgi:transcriptional regulator with XRE-family HTH domain
MDDRTVGFVLRALRRRRGWRQSDLAARARVSQSTVSRVERGWLQDLTIRTLRLIFGALEAGAQVTPRWRGAELERLIDEDHSIVVDELVRRLERLGWSVEIEVTYAEFGERGSIDVLGLRPEVRAIVVVEVKTDLVSSEAVGRKLDEKARLAPGIVARRDGWTPTSVGRVLVMPGTMRLRRLVERHPVIDRMLPAGSVALRQWLRQPAGAVAGVWFLSDIAPRTPGDGRRLAPRRIRSVPSVTRGAGDAETRRRPSGSGL